MITEVTPEIKALYSREIIELLKAKFGAPLSVAKHLEKKLEKYSAAQIEANYFYAESEATSRALLNMRFS